MVSASKRKEYDARYKAKHDLKLRYRRYREELPDSYLAVCLSRKLNMTVPEVKSEKGLIEAYRLNLQIKRKLKQLRQNG